MSKKLKNKEVEIPSKYLTKPRCTQFPSCGGCAFQNISYEGELEVKNNSVLGLLNNLPGLSETAGFEYLGCVPAPNIDGYRNKMELNFGDESKGGALMLGMRKKGSRYEVSNAAECLICDADMRNSAREIRDYFANNTNEAFYNKIRHTGSLRNIIIRKAYFTGEIMINIVTASSVTAPLGPLAEKLCKMKYSGKLAGILHTLCDTVSDAVKADETRLMYGDSYIYEELLGLKFKISPFSFFQTNSAGAELLYSTALEFAEDLRGKTVYDLYCGTGTITQLLAENAANVTGVELCDESVSAAIQNAQANNLGNCKFIVGDVLKILDTLPPCADLIVVDPPREGIHPKAIDKIIKFAPHRVIYISCKPSSLARDLKIFIQNGYRVSKIKCHDMFPRTNNIEVCCCLDREGL